jgi:hypothetical protein
MTDLTTLLMDGDPVRVEEGLDPADADRIRRRVIAAAGEAARVGTPWHRPFAVAAVAVLLVIAGTIRSHQTVEPTVAAEDPFAMSGSSGDTDRRQLQFATPGGTRIIWIFDENLRLQESMP